MNIVQTNRRSNKGPMNRTKFGYLVLQTALGLSLTSNSLAWAETLSGKALLIGQGVDIAQIAPRYGQAAPDVEAPKVKDLHGKESAKGTKESAKESAKEAEVAKVPEPPLENLISVTPDQLVSKPQDYLNKNVKFTAPFFVFSNLALDYKPAFRSSRTYLSFLVLRPGTHTPYSEIKLTMLAPKEKDPQTKLLQMLKEGDQIEICGKVFATPLDEPWLDVLRLKKLNTPKKGGIAEDKTAEKDSADDESKNE